MSNKKIQKNKSNEKTKNQSLKPSDETANSKGETLKPEGEAANAKSESLKPEIGNAKTKNGFEILTKYRGAIMGIAALWILFFHEWQPVMTAGTKIAEYESYIKRIGFCGVDIFLFLSGIGLVFAIGKGSILSFYYRRLKRVYLPFLIVALIRFFIESWQPAILRDYVLCVSFYKVSMYSFLWFVPAILTLYLFFPLYYKLFEKSADKFLFTASAFLIWFMLTMLFRDKMRNDLFGFTNRIPVFLFGIYAGHLTKTRKEPFNRSTWIMLVVTLVTGLYSAYLANFIGIGFIVPVSNCCFPNLLIAVSFPFVVSKGFDLLCSIPKIGIVSKAIVKVFAFFGLFSLELYCVQEWLSGILLGNIADRTPMFKNVMIFLVSSAAGFVLYLIVKYFWIDIEFVMKKISAHIKKSDNKA